MKVAVQYQTDLDHFCDDVYHSGISALFLTSWFGGSFLWFLGTFLVLTNHCILLLVVEFCASTCEQVVRDVAESIVGCCVLESICH